MLDKLKRNLSKLTCQYFFSGFRGTKELKIGGFSEKVYIFKASHVKGMCTTWGDILLDERLFEADQLTRNYVFMHEMGHKKRPLLRNLGGMFQMMLYPTGLVLGVSAILVLAYSSITQNTVLAILSPGQSFRYLLALLVLFPTAIVLSYITETQAELFSLDRVGEENYREAHRKIKEMESSDGLLRKAFERASHPPPALIMKIYQLLR